MVELRCSYRLSAVYKRHPAVRISGSVWLMAGMASHSLSRRWTQRSLCSLLCIYQAFFVFISWIHFYNKVSQSVSCWPLPHILLPQCSEMAGLCHRDHLQGWLYALSGAALSVTSPTSVLTNLKSEKPLSGSYTDCFWCLNQTQRQFW